LAEIGQRNPVGSWDFGWREPAFWEGSAWFGVGRVHVENLTWRFFLNHHTFVLKALSSDDGLFGRSRKFLPDVCNLILAVATAERNLHG
jgi:hypothetical protein